MKPWQGWMIAVLSTASVPVLSQGRACTWSRRDSIRVAGDYEYVYVEPPLTAMAGTQGVMIGGQAAQRSLAGKVTLQPSGNVYFAGLLLADTGRMTQIQLPAGLPVFDYPRIAGLPDGELVVVWQGGRTLADTVVSRIWTASLQNGKWSSPKLIGDWPVGPIELTAASEITVRGTEASMVAPGPSSLVLLRRTAGVWRRYELPQGIPPLYPTLLDTGDGFLLGTVDNTGLEITHLSREGMVTRRTVVAPVRSTNFHMPKLLAASASEELVTWVDAAFSERSVVRVARSSDGGVTWTETASLPVEDGLQSFDAIFRDGVLYVTGRKGGPWPFAAALRGNEWKALDVRRGQDEIGIVPPRYSRAAKDVRLYWGVSLEERVQREPPILVGMVLGNGCWR